MSMRISSSSPEGSRREKKKLLIYVGTFAAFIFFWTILIFALGVGGSGAGNGGGGGSGNAGHATAAGSGHGGANAKDRMPQKVEDTVFGSEDHKDYATPENPEKFMQEEQARDKAAQNEPTMPQGGAHDDIGADPLGIANQDIPLTPLDQDRVKAAASKFVAAAYGYAGAAGTDRDYISKVNDAVLSPEFYSTPGADEVRRYSSLVRKSGTKSAARMDRFDIQSASQDQADGYVYFVTADAYDHYGNLTGPKQSYRQKLTIVRYNAVFKVKAADKIQEVTQQ